MKLHSHGETLFCIVRNMPSFSVQVCDAHEARSTSSCCSVCLTFEEHFQQYIYMNISVGKKKFARKEWSRRNKTKHNGSLMCSHSFMEGMAVSPLSWEFLSETTLLSQRELSFKPDKNLWLYSLLLLILAWHRVQFCTINVKPETSHNECGWQTCQM